MPERSNHLIAFVLLALLVSFANPSSAKASKLQITDINVSFVDSVSAQITWHTNQPATSQVDYGEDLAANIYLFHTPENQALSFDHTVALMNLNPATTYHFQLTSKAPSIDQAAVSADKTFTTLANKRIREAIGAANFGQILSPEPTQVTPRLNPYARVLGQHTGPGTNSSTATNDIDYYNPVNRYPYPYPPIAVVYPPDSSTNVTTPPIPTPTSGEKEEIRSSPTLETAVYTQSTEQAGLFLIVGVTIGVTLAGIFLKLRTSLQSPSQENNSKANRYEFSVSNS